MNNYIIVIPTYKRHEHIWQKGTLKFLQKYKIPKNKIVLFVANKTEKKIYCDMMFTNDDEEFIQWTQHLESTIKNLIFEKRNLWFHNDMDHDSIDYHWQNLLRTLMSG